MNPTPHRNSFEIDQALDHRLSQQLSAPDAQLAPSSGFVLSVMDAIQQQATEPQPLPFPWRRALPGAIAALCTLVAFVIFNGHVLLQTAATSSRPLAPLPTLDLTAPATILLTVILTVALTLATTLASLRLVTGGR